MQIHNLEGMIDRGVHLAADAERFCQVGSFHNGRYAALPRDVGSHDIDNRLRNALRGRIVGTGQNLGATDGNVERGREFSQSMEVGVGKRLFKPVIVQPLQLPTHPQRLLVRVRCHRVCHQLEIGADGFPACAIGRKIKIHSAGWMQFVRVPPVCFRLQRLPRIVFRCIQHEGARVDRDPVAVSAEELVQRQSAHLPGNIPQADVKRTVGVDRNVIPPAIVSAKILPELLAEERVLSFEERLEG